MTKMMVVEDHKETAKLISDYVQMFFPKWEVRYETKGMAAILTALSYKPDVILLDIALADEVDGIRVVRELSKNQLKTRVVLLTALGNKAFRGPRPGMSWLDQLDQHERPMVARFFEKDCKWKDLLTAVAEAAGAPVPEDLNELEG